MMDSICSGLGFTRVNNSSENSTSKDKDDRTVDSLMNQYMQSCLSYHEEQQMEVTSEAPAFVPASLLPSIQHPSDGALPTQVATEMETAPNLSNHNPLPNQTVKPSSVSGTYSDESSKQKAIANARAIAKRLAETCHTDSTRPNSTTDETPTNSPQFYAQQRQSFRHHHDLKLQRALLKNFSYVMHRDKHDSNILVHHMRQVQQQQQDTIKRNKDRRSQTGIGTREQKLCQKSNQNILPSIGLYITGLPTNQTTSLHPTLKSLFGAYGTVHKVVLYNDKCTGKPKGDALILYDPSSSRNLVETVCSQVSNFSEFIMAYLRTYVHTSRTSKDTTSTIAPYPTHVHAFRTCFG